MDPPTPLREPEEEQKPPQSPGALSGFRKGVMRTLQTAPQYIMAGAVVAAAAAGFLKVRRKAACRALLPDACTNLAVSSSEASRTSGASHGGLCEDLPKISGC